MASKVNVGNRTPEQDAEAKKTLKAQSAKQGAKVQETTDGTFAVTEAFGFKITTRIG